MPTIEVNGTFYRTQTPATFAKWASETPDGFVFALKGPRYAVNRRVLAEAGDSIKRFVDSGPLELGDKLGPMLWQFAPTKKFDAADFGAFLALLPHKVGSTKLRHVVEVRHDSFCTPEFIKLARDHNVPIVFAEHETYPAIADVTGDFIYARLQKGKRRGEDRLCAEGARRLGQALCRPGPRAASRPTCRSSTRSTSRPRSRATRSSTSSTRARCARRTRRWR